MILKEKISKDKKVFELIIQFFSKRILENATPLLFLVPDPYFCKTVTVCVTLYSHYNLNRVNLQLIFFFSSFKLAMS